MLFITALAMVPARAILGPTMGFWDAIAIIGLIGAWPTIEAIFHVGLLHSRYNILPTINHAIHHANPTPENGLMPIFFSLQFMAGCWLAWPRPYLSTAAATVMVLTCWYEALHYLIHAGKAPAALTHHHLLHHHWPHMNFSISSTRH